jgi:NAD(P)-dependent dehydrogenase (short-subunit alcohol dehydrogenase family)
MMYFLEARWSSGLVKLSRRRKLPRDVCRLDMPDSDRRPIHLEHARSCVLINRSTAQGCKVSAHDLRPNPLANTHPSLHCLLGDISSESSIQTSIASAIAHFSLPISILCANAGITDESASYPIWDMPVSLWDRTYSVNVRGTFLTIKHFLKSVEKAQMERGEEVKNLSVVVTGSECGVFGQAGHVEYASGKSGLQYGLVKSVKNEIVRLNKRARINAVAPGWVDTKLIEGRLDDPKEMWREAEATYVLHSIIAA